MENKLGNIPRDKRGKRLEARPRHWDSDVHRHTKNEDTNICLIIIVIILKGNLKKRTSWKSSMQRQFPFRSGVGQ